MSEIKLPSRALAPVSPNNKYHVLQTDGEKGSFVPPKGIAWFNADIGLKRWRAALSNSNNALANLVFLAHSWGSGFDATNGYGFAQQLANYLQSQFGQASNESIVPFINTTTPNTRFVKTVGTWADHSQGGICGKSFGETGNTKKLTISNLSGDAVEVFTILTTDTTSDWSYKIDGGSSVNVSQTPSGSLATNEVVKTSIDLTDGLHTLEITAPSTGYVHVNAIATVSGTSGVRVYNWWLGSGTAGDFADAADNRAKAFQSSEPNLTVIMLTLNDDFQSLTISDTIANLQLLIDAAYEVDSDVLLITEFPASLSNDLESFADAVRVLAISNGCAHLQLSTLFSTYSEASDLGLYSGDNVHPGDKGHSAIFQPLADELGLKFTNQSGTTPLKQPIELLISETDLDDSKSGRLFITSADLAGSQQVNLNSGTGGTIYDFWAGDGLTINIPTGVDVIEEDGSNATNEIITIAAGSFVQLICIFSGFWLMKSQKGINTGNQSPTGFDENNPVLDTNGNILQAFGAVDDAVNYIKVTNAISGGRPSFSAEGADDNIGLLFAAKGGEAIFMQGAGFIFIDQDENEIDFFPNRIASQILDIATNDGILTLKDDNSTGHVVFDPSILDVTLNQGLKPAHLADSDAPNDSIYFSTDSGKLAYKDSGGTVNNLY